MRPPTQEHGRASVVFVLEARSVLPLTQLAEAGDARIPVPPSFSAFTSTCKCHLRESPPAPPFSPDDDQMI